MSDRDSELVERRIGIAVALEHVAGELKTLTVKVASLKEIQTNCAGDRSLLFKRITQIDKQFADSNKAMGILDTKQKCIIGIGSFVGLTTVAMAIRTIFTLFGKNSHGS